MWDSKFVLLIRGVTEGGVGWVEGRVGGVQQVMGQPQAAESKLGGGGGKMGEKTKY
jgi:hypothetical protein